MQRGGPTDRGSRAHVLGRCGGGGPTVRGACGFRNVGGTTAARTTAGRRADTAQRATEATAPTRPRRAPAGGGEAAGATNTAPDARGDPSPCVPDPDGTHGRGSPPIDNHGRQTRARWQGVESGAFGGVRRRDRVLWGRLCALGRVPGGADLRCRRGRAPLCVWPRPLGRLCALGRVLWGASSALGRVLWGASSACIVPGSRHCIARRQACVARVDAQARRCRCHVSVWTDADRRGVDKARTLAAIQEHFEGRTDLVVNDTNPKQSVHIFKCSNSAVRIEGKINEILIGTPKRRTRAFHDRSTNGARGRARLHTAQTTAQMCRSCLTTPSAASTLSTAASARSRSRA